MFEKMLMPLNRHFDDGHEGAADAFKEAAEKLETNDESSVRSINAHLPINFLYRHAIELYLKSAIVTVHRSLGLPSGDGPHERDPLVKDKGKWRRLDRTHSVKVLLVELDRLIRDYNDRIKLKSNGNWESPEELHEWIDVIEKADQGSTYFRYAKSGNPTADNAKSSFQPVGPQDLRAAADGDQPPGMFLLMLDDDENVVEAFGHKRNLLPDFAKH
ncbi:MAG TPA: hypothetical protein VFE46_02625 [Pirellulales bacterium]|jgi:hypothetical protein|nr:hypothetical protein [Pirellulales bacterium]